MELEVLVSTMNIENEKEHLVLIKKMNIKTKSLTINQISDAKMSENPVTSNVRNRMISKNEIGLGKSRNLAIKESKEDICILADDDLIYEQDYDKIVKEEYKKNKNIDIICFLVESNNNKRKVKKMRTSKIGKLRAMRICSCQITFKKNRIVENNIKFDEKFGAGTYYDRGEETIFLWECIDKGLKIKFVNKKIAHVNQEESTWFKGYDKTFFEKQGAVFYRMSPKLFKLLIFQFAIRKYRLYKENISIKNAICSMLQGAKEFQK